MRILYHHRTQAEDAQGIHINEMINAFRELGHEVEVVALAENKSSREEPPADTNGETVDDRPKPLRARILEKFAAMAPAWLYELMAMMYNLIGYRMLRKSIKANRPDLIYERYSLNTFCCIWASRKFGIPHVLEMNLPLYYEQSKFGTLAFPRTARKSERWICANSTRTVIVSATMRDYFVTEGVPKEKMLVMPNAIDPEVFNSSISGDEIRARYGLEGQLVAGFVGWFREWHGLDLLIETMHRDGHFENGYRLLMVGDGPAFGQLEQYVQQNNLQSFVVFAGPVDRDEIAQHVAAMDVTLVPRTNEYGCPMKVIEYMAMGKCIVAPDQPVIRELVENDVNAFLFSLTDPDGLSAALRKASANPQLRKAFGERAAKDLDDREFYWSANARRALQIAAEAKSGS